MITGRCLCGDIQFEISSNPLWVAYCHCETCRRSTGAPVTAYAGFAQDTFSYLQGTPRVFHSSPDVQRSFCPRCGSPLTYASDRFPGEIHLHISALDHPEAFQPEAHVYFHARIPWFDVVDDRPRYGELSAQNQPDSWGILQVDGPPVDSERE